jgi:hypothetical protein
MTDADKILICRRFLRGEYKDRLAELKTLYQTTFATATEEVTLTSTSFEGGMTGGQMKFDKMILLAAIGDLLADVDPDALPEHPPGGGFVQQFSAL